MAVLTLSSSAIQSPLTSTVEKANGVVKAINDAEPNRAIAVVGDILDDKYIQDLVDKAAAFGNGKIHIIVNNAGFTWDGVIHKAGTLLLPPASRSFLC
jgi:NAD(P)-dependent dehydrogenase (short-subunit alcohol dehydrogenase family)